MGGFPAKSCRNAIGGPAATHFAEVWPEVHELLKDAPGLMAKTVFDWLQTKYPGKFDNSLLRSFQRGVKRWRATEGAASNGSICFNALA